MTVASGTRALKVGIMLPQTEGIRGAGIRGWRAVREMALVAEQCGFDSLWTVDHLLFQLHGEPSARGVWEGWSMLSALAATTTRVEIGACVMCLGWRNPALLAKMADTVDEISGGRLILGLGSGYHRPEYDAFGYPFDYRVSRFEEAIQIVHGLLRRGEVDFEGRFHHARRCVLRPRGPRPAGPPILIGTAKHRMLAVTAKYADIWNGDYETTGNRLEGVAQLNAVVDAACRSEGRAPETLERSLLLMVADESADPWWERVRDPAAQASIEPVRGSSEEIAATLLDLERAGITHVQINLEPTTCETIERLVPVLEALDAA